MESFNKYFLNLIKDHYADFKGRARRQEFWMYIVFYIVIGVVLGIIDSFIGIRILGGIFGLAVLIPSLAVGARRLHDTGKSGWFQLLGLIPFVGIIILIVFWAQEGVPEENKWGANPKV